MEAIEYRLVRSKRKTVAIEVTNEGEVIVRAPKRTPLYRIEEILQDRREWIKEHRKKAALRKKEKEAFLSENERITPEEMREMGDRMIKEFPPRVKKYAEKIGVTYGRITVRNQKTRWGSCSTKGNLNFNCLLMMAPVEIQDYVIVHELCHRIEMNHSPKYWELVASVMPDYEKYKRWLKKEGEKILIRAFG